MKKLLKNQAQVRIEKVIKKNLDKLCLKWESYDNSCNGLIDKKDERKISEYSPKTNKFYGSNIKVDLFLSNYQTKTDLKGAADVTSI